MLGMQKQNIDNWKEKVRNMNEWRIIKYFKMCLFLT